MTIKVGSVYNVTFKSGNTHTAFSWPSKIPDSGNKYMKHKLIKITKKLNPKDSLDFDYVVDVYDKIDGAIELKNIKIVSKQLILKSSTFKVAGKRKKSKKKTQKKSKRKNTKKRTQNKRTQKKRTQKKTRRRMRGGSARGEAAKNDHLISNIAQKALSNGEEEAIKKEIAELGDVNATYSINGNTALHMVVTYKNEGAVKLLLECGADPTIKNNQGKTPLDIAKKKENTEIIKLLSGAASQPAGGGPSGPKDSALDKGLRVSEGRSLSASGIAEQGGREAIVKLHVELKHIQRGLVVSLVPLPFYNIGLQITLKKPIGGWWGEPEKHRRKEIRGMFSHLKYFLEQLKTLTEGLLPRFANFRDMNQTSKGYMSGSGRFSGNSKNSVYTPKKVYPVDLPLGMTFGDLYLDYRNINVRGENGQKELLKDVHTDPLVFWCDIMTPYTERQFLSGRGTYGDDDKKAGRFFDEILKKCSKEDFQDFETEMFKLVGRGYKSEEMTWVERDGKYVPKYKGKVPLVMAIHGMTQGRANYYRDKILKHIFNFELRGIAITAIEAIGQGGSAYRHADDGRIFKGINYLKYEEVQAIMEVIMKTFVFFMSNMNSDCPEHREVSGRFNVLKGGFRGGPVIAVGEGPSVVIEGIAGATSEPGRGSFTRVEAVEGRGLSGASLPPRGSTSGDAPTYVRTPVPPLAPGAPGETPRLIAVVADGEAGGR